MRSLLILAVVIFCSVVPCFAGDGVLPASAVRVSGSAGNVYRVSPDELDAVMNRVARKSATEDLWFYVPKTGLLYDFGVGGDSNNGCISYSAIRKFAEALSGQEVVNIHNHPSSAADHNVYPPSRMDLGFYAEYGRMFRDELGIKWNLSLVYDGKGVWGTVLSDDFTAAYVKDDPRHKNISSIALRVKSRKIIRGLIKLMYANPSSDVGRQVLVDKYISGVESLGINHSYRSLP